MRRSILTIAVAALLLSITAIVSAQPVPPHKFYGTAYVNGQSAPEGSIVAAFIGDEKVGEAMVDSAGNYSLTTMGSLEYSGRAVTFRVTGRAATETVTWMQAGITQVDLNIAGSGRIGPPLVPPHAFSGLVTVDGNLVAGGVIVAATIEGRKVASTITSEDGRYKLKVQQRTVNFIGKTVTFTVDGEIASQSAFWRQGGVDLLDLSVHSGPRPTAEVFSNLISDGSLVAVWMYHNQTRSWSVFDPRPEAAPVNDLIEVARKDILWVEVSRESAFQGQTLYEGWNLITLR